MAQKPSIPKGTRDFSPLEMARRNYIFDTIKETFRNFGYQQIETPSIENLSTLLGKYGDEGDRLIFKIINSGDYLKDVSEEIVNQKDSKKLLSYISEKGLRYDLTVPFARYVVQYRNDINLPFKRFQIQPVWRADRPQKGRYREFYQCDADVVGSESLWNEVELLLMIDSVFRKLRLNVTTKINNRKVLTGLAELIGYPDKIIDITVAIDKLDKIGIDNVNLELESKGISREAIEKLQPVILLDGPNDEKLKILKDLFKDNAEGLKGVEELETVIRRFKEIKPDSYLDLDISLARGLNYYTGTILEVKSRDMEIGSIAGGGRYDNLTGVFGMSGLSGVGISFGADRIYDVLNKLNLYPETITESVKLMFVNFGEKEAVVCMKLLKNLRESGISSELYPDSTKMKKQMSYADSMNIPFIALVGENEINESCVKLKEMKTGEQFTLKFDELIKFFKKEEA